MLSLTFRQIEYAVAVARHGGMSAAASALHVSQPALSVALGQLEATLGQPLFLRQRGGRLQPSPFGHRWLDRAERCLGDLRQLADPAQIGDLSLRLAVFEDIAASCLAPLLAAAASGTPALRLTATPMGFEPLLAALRAGRVDLALTWDLGLERDISRKIVAQIPPHAVLAADHPLAAKAQITLQDLATEPLVLTDQGRSVDHMRGLFARQSLTPVIAHRTATLALMRSYAANGLGVGLSYTNPASRRAQDGKPLVTRPIADAGAEALVLAWSGMAPLSGAAVALGGLLPGVLQGDAFPDLADCGA